MATITISRQFGAGGKTLGSLLAKRMGYRCVDDVMVKEVAKEINVSLGQVRGFEKEGGANLMKFIEKVVSREYIIRLISDRYGYVDEKKYVGAVRSIVLELHRQGNVIIVGRGSQYILKDTEDVYHILLVKGLKERIRFIEEQYGKKKEEAQKIVARADKNRIGFLSFFQENKSPDDPLLYDLTLNTEHVTLEKAVDLVEALISK